ncbi:MAG: YhbY family RNA-binding protein [Bacillota bacterium]|nr:YhbY family RNA-binding protein [Bacillota bacterium]
MKLTPKQTAELKKLANPLSSKYQIGKGELSESTLDMLDKALEANELIKVSILQNSASDKEEVSSYLEEKLSCAIVQVIGRVIVLYRPSKKHPRNLLK